MVIAILVVPGIVVGSVLGALFEHMIFGRFAESDKSGQVQRGAR